MGNQTNDEPLPARMLATAARVESGQTPEDAMAAAHKVVNAALRDDLLALLQVMSPTQFERLIWICWPRWATAAEISTTVG